MTIALVVVGAYLMGSIPFGYLAGRVRGVDIRSVGSRNVGATNVFRTLGRRAGISVMALDIGKGLAAALAARGLTESPWPLVAAAAAVAGHVAPVWLRFRGGKGVATGAGVVIGLMPIVSAILVVGWLAIVGVTRYVSLASVAAAIAFPPLAVALGEPWPTVVFAAALSLAVLVRHGENISRLVRGQEHRIRLGRGQTRE
ncbi:MAG: glycerol-3-phosphate 1-O-acyltransferase PlsY [Actinobacteria bacterium]|nr:glycerol-3-phosphate 1-O-acyltransferase PlsY [Actinomycetota bacterium]